MLVYKHLGAISDSIIRYLGAMMVHKKVPKCLVAAWLRKIRRCKSVFNLNAGVTSAPVVRKRSLLQGDPAASPVFNATLDIPAARFLKLAGHEEWGFRLDDGSYVS